MDWNALRAEFPRHEVDWRANSVSQKDPDNPVAMALAYIDARAVMDRLDAVCGPHGWQCSYTETPQGRVLCTLSILVNGEWVSKSDGSGASDIEGEKGGISGALKRAAVAWGIGRYLYDMETPWVPCELYKGKWNKWKVDPWTRVRKRGTPPPESDPGAAVAAEEPAKAVEEKAEGEKAKAADAWAANFAGKVRKAEGPLDATQLVADNAAAVGRLKAYPDALAKVEAALKEHGCALTIRDGKASASEADIPDDDLPERVKEGARFMAAG
jgi:hypothetical protein